MDEILDEIAATTGVARPTVEKAVGIIIAFLAREGPGPQVQQLMAGIPGARELAERGGGTGRGLFGVYGDLAGAGLSIGQIQSVAGAFLAAARQRIGSAQVDQVIAGVPGLSQFI